MNSRPTLTYDPMIILSLHHLPNKRQAALQQKLAERFTARGLEFISTPPLYQVTETCAFWRQLAKLATKPVVVGWLYPRPTVWLLSRHQIVLDESQIVNLQPFSDVEPALAAVEAAIQAKAAGKMPGKPSKPGKKPLSRLASEMSAETSERWYPVIDGSRCINCGHCLQFCLFGVYESDAEQKVWVANPDQCKMGCPACSRICPRSAIMFPLYDKDDAIAGAPGRFVALDAAARRMFYTRTKKTCPECGCKADRKSSAKTGEKNVCPECGGSLPRNKSKENAASAERPAFDDLDLLVEQLDKTMQRRPKPHE